MNDPIKLASDLRQIFEKTHTKLNNMGFPFFFNFPVNCCQGSSILLALEVSEKFPELNVEVVQGSTRTRDIHHYWVEIDNKTYDLTLDQFLPWMDKKYQCPTHPIYAVTKYPLRNYFFYKERYSAIEAYVIFCSNHANLRDVIKVQRLVKKELKICGWE